MANVNRFVKTFSEKDSDTLCNVINKFAEEKELKIVQMTLFNVDTFSAYVVFEQT